MKKLEEVYKKTKEPIAFISSIVTIVLMFTGGNNLFRYILCGIVGIYILCFCWYVVKSLLDTNKAKQEFDRDYSQKHHKVALRLHGYFHNLRDYSSSIYSVKTLTLEDVVDKCRNICDYIAEFYRALLGNCLGDDAVSVCIKLIKTESIFDEFYTNWEMETIARSTTTIQQRNNIDKNPVKISENSDFQIIISRKYQDELFSFSDMRNIDEDFLLTYQIPYRNSRGEDFIKYYRSTIVVPIKIDGKHASQEVKIRIKNVSEKSLILGFLCIDSMKVFETEHEKKMFSLSVEYAKTLGDSLYLFFEKILLCCLENDKINSSDNNTVKNVSDSAYNT